MNTHYTLSQLCEQIEEALSYQLESTYWVQAEISSLSEKSGHLYLELIESEEQHGKRNTTRNMLAAKMRAMCWQGNKEMLLAYFQTETGQNLQVGMQILVEVEVVFHPVYGLSLSIVNIDPTFTIGDLAKQRQITINRLTEEGIIDMQRLHTLPTIVRRIAVISSPTAAGYGDFIHQLEQSPYRFSTGLFGATMQGDGAEKSILAALDAVDAQSDQWDAVAIIRGGGATTDLTCFDRYTLCAVCAQYSLPILTGIGHTRDVSILDMVAHKALKTPTAVAEWLIHRMDEQAEQINILATRLLRTAERQVLIRKHRVEMLEQRILACNPMRIYQMGYSLLTKDGHIVRSIKDLHIGDRVTTHLPDGTINARIEP